MNTAAKIFCRMYQACFRMALPLLPYRQPKILQQVEEIPAVLQDLQVSSVLLVTDSFLRSSGYTAALESALANRGIACAVYDGVQPNPTVQNVTEACKVYRSANCSAIIAFGGGSPMDCAKAAGACIAYPHKTMAQLKGLLRVRKKIPTLFAIPTTAGTGSEVTVTAVITDSEKKNKYTMNSFPLIPHYAVLDPRVTYSLPPHLTATTGMDALTHVVEAYIGGSTTKETRKLSLEATRLIFQNLSVVYKDGTNRKGRANMLLAAYKAGIAFSKSYVGYVHAVAHSLGGQYNIPHGLANAVLLPVVLEEFGATVYKKLKSLAVAAGVAPESDTDEQAAKKFIDAIKQMNKDMGIPQTLDGICHDDIPTMARHAAKEANPLYPVPKLMNAAELEVLYRKVSANDQ